MEINFRPNGVLEINGAKIIWRNFEGRATDFKPAGNREFVWVIPNKELADKLVADGWNVKVKEAEEGYDDDMYYLAIKVSYKNGNGPNAYLISGKNHEMLNEGTIGRLDRISISTVDMDIRPYDWEYLNRSGRTAYLNLIRVFQEVDRFAMELAEGEYPGEQPW